MADPSNPSASRHDIFEKFTDLTAVTPSIEDVGGREYLNLEEEILEDEGDDEDDDDDEKDLETSDETDDPTKPAAIEKRKKKLRLARLKKKSKKRAYEFSGGSDVVGIVFLDIGKITDLPPERNSTYVILLSLQQMLN